MKRSVDNLRWNEKFSLYGSKSTRSSESERIRHRRSGGSVGKVADHGGGGGGGGGERVCGLADLAKNFLGIADFNNNFSGYADPVNLMDLDFCKNSVRITDSKHNSNEPVIEPSITFLSEHLSRCLYCTTLELEHSNVLILRVHSRAKL